MSLFIAHPWLALVFAAVFLWLARKVKRNVVRLAAFGWLGYAGYEFGMQQRWFCTGECNIRVDLLLLYPLLTLVTIAALLAALRSRRPTRT